MNFRYTNAYVGPFCVSYAEANEGDSQRYRFPLPVISREHLGQGLMITKGRFRVVWPQGSEGSDLIMDEGGSFALDSPVIPFAVDAEFTLTALSTSAFLCVTAAGTEQKVRLERHYLRPGETMLAERYTLLAIVGAESVIRANGGDPLKGIRLLYGRNGEISLEATTSCVVGKFYFVG